jgi:hypothetical protein
MKKSYIAILAGSIFFSTTLYSCGTDNTTGVDTETTDTEINGELEDESEGEMMHEDHMDSTNMVDMNKESHMNGDGHEN